MEQTQENQTYWRVIFALLLALCGLLFFVLIRGEPGDFHGIQHPEKTDMMVGGPAIERAGSLLWIGWGFGTLQLVLFVALLAPGVSRFAAAQQKTRHGNSTSAMNRILWIGGLVYVGAFATVMYCYRLEIYAPDAKTWHGFPTSSFLAIFVFWPVPYLFVAAYSLGFKRFIYHGECESS